MTPQFLNVEENVSNIFDLDEPYANSQFIGP